MLNVALSIDFDFFSRERVEWDWGHDEATDLRVRRMFEIAVWRTRYAAIDLYEEAGVHHADVPPHKLFSSLNKLGVSLGRNVQVGFADSHAYAFDFFANRRGGQYDLLLNVDAHHDLFGLGTTQEVHCGNWMQHLFDAWEGSTRLVQVYPRWKDMGLDGPPSRPVDLCHWEQLAALLGNLPKPFVVDRVFLCRSPVWLPPHHDDAFLKLVHYLRRQRPHGSFEQLGPPMLVRKPPTRKEAQELMRQHREAVALFRLEALERRHD